MNVDLSFQWLNLLQALYFHSAPQWKYWMILCCFLVGSPGNTRAQEELTTSFERNNNRSASYPEVISYYKTLDSIHSQVALREIGKTDAGLPLHALILSTREGIGPEEAKRQGKLIYFVNNGIHPGEPCGIDASMMWVRDLLRSDERDRILEEAVILLIPVYNVGGALNRSSFSRANQNGPRMYGFRGNAKNLDLNRDFIKCDSKNAQSLTRFFARWKPDLFLDTHTSNGSDYQHTMTYIASLADRMAQAQKSLLYDTILPELKDGMRAAGWDLIPYVYSRANPREGIFGFDDTPRYSSGYAALHYALSFISEAHMLKPFEDRVESTYDMIDHMLKVGLHHRENIHRARMQAIREDNRRTFATIRHRIDARNADSIEFKGYTAEKRLSELTQGEILFYDRSRPWEDSVAYYEEYRPNLSIRPPNAYIIPRAWTEVIDRLRWNGIEMHRLAKDTVLHVDQYYIRDMQTRDAPYEGHYLHSEIVTEEVSRPWPFRRGDWVVPVEGDQLRFLLNTCEPRATDSWMAWNFFDAVLQQKEHFSAYVFHETALELLEQNRPLQKAFEEQRASDPDFASDTRAQLDFIYKRSPYYEKTHRLYPIARYMGRWQTLPVRDD